MASTMCFCEADITLVGLAITPSRPRVRKVSNSSAAMTSAPLRCDSVLADALRIIIVEERRERYAARLRIVAVVQSVAL